jgi:hypothetical protein
VVAAVHAAAAVAAAAGVRRGSTMNSKTRMQFVALLAYCLIGTSGALAATTQQTFATPEDAASALAAAVKGDDIKALRSVLGNAGGTLSSGDPVADRAAAKGFVADYDAKHVIVREGDAAKLVIGTDDFPFAFPLVKAGDRWRFDTAAGVDELNARRIGRNELTTIKVLQAAVDAQRDYASQDRDGDGVPAYARKIVSSPGKRDGLYWPTKPGESQSPMGDLVAKASSEGYRTDSKSGPAPFHGYFFRMLRGQGASAGSPAFDYVVHGRAIGGFAMIAYPAKYGSSGIMTFIVNQDGKVFQSDLGPETHAKASEIRRFDPGKRWSPVAP